MWLRASPQRGSSCDYYQPASRQLGGGVLARKGAQAGPDAIQHQKPHTNTHGHWVTMCHWSALPVPLPFTCLRVMLNYVLDKCFFI